MALGFLLGGIVGPPDAVSAGAILKFVKIPKQTATILEGESLLNDASSLIIFRFALLAIKTGSFVWSSAIFSFSWMVFGGAAIGLALAWFFVKMHKLLPTNPSSNIAFTLVEPYVLYWVAEQAHSSGVMAVVCGRLFMSTRRFQFLTGEGFIKGFSFWESFIFILNGIVFFIICLELPEFVNGLKQEEISIGTGIWYGMAVTAIVIIVRIISSYIAGLATYLFRRSVLTNVNRKQARTWPLFLGWTGIRGVVSLPSALSIPAYLANGEEFPHRI